MGTSARRCFGPGSRSMATRRSPGSSHSRLLWTRFRNMPVQDDLYEAVLEAPDRLGPRRRYAEYLEQHGDELGHYIRLRLQQLQASLDNQSYERMLELEVKLGPRLR